MMSSAPREAFDAFLLFYRWSSDVKLSKEEMVSTFRTPLTGKKPKLESYKMHYENQM